MMNFLDLLDDVEKQNEEMVLKVARESVSTEQEKEYCLWVKPTVEGWKWLYENGGDFYLDVLLPVQSGKRRIRIESGKAELTMKTFANGACVEENSDIGFATALTFYADGGLAHLVQRTRLEPGELAKQGGKHWDIDVFYTYSGRPMIPDQEAFDDIVATAKAGTSVCEWVKVELEVERFELESIRPHLPFEVEEVVNSRPTNEEDKLFLRDYWDNVTRL